MIINRKIMVKILREPHYHRKWLTHISKSTEEKESTKERKEVKNEKLRMRNGRIVGSPASQNSD